MNHLQSQNPRRLAQLVANPEQFRREMDSRTWEYLRAVREMRRADPNRDPVEMDEVAINQVLCPEEARPPEEPAAAVAGAEAAAERYLEQNPDYSQPAGHLPIR